MVRQVENAIELHHDAEDGTSELLHTIEDWSDLPALLEWCIAGPLEGLIDRGDDVWVSGTWVSLAGLFVAAFSIDHERHQAARLLARFDVSFLVSLGEVTDGLRGTALMSVLKRALAAMDRHDLSPEDLPAGLSLDGAGLDDLERRLTTLIDELVTAPPKEDAAAHARIDALRPLAGQIEQVISRWRAAQGRRPYFPPTGTWALRQFLERYCLEHGKLPDGRHLIPLPGSAGSGKEGFEVNFDKLT